MYSTPPVCFRDEETNFIHTEQVADPQHIANLTFSYTGLGNYYPVSDTFWLSGGENLRFNFSGSHIFRVMAGVDGKSVFDEDHNATIWIDSRGLAEGPHELEITQFVKSGTGSLADKLDVEMVPYTATFVLMIGDFTFTPVIQSIEVTNEGGVNIQWNSYDRSDFQAYEVRKYSSSSTYLLLPLKRPSSMTTSMVLQLWIIIFLQRSTIILNSMI